MEELKKIVSDEELNNAWGNANFGNVEKRDIIKITLLKYASDYHSGHTAKCIVQELGLVSKKLNLTKKGKKYLYEAFSKDSNI